eukprot:7154068-Prymnesium_polylepis.1
MAEGGTARCRRARSGSSLDIPSRGATCAGHVDPDDCDCCAADRDCCGSGGGGDVRPRVSGQIGSSVDIP